MTETGRGIDWQEIYAQLERTSRALEAGGGVPPEEAKRILRERAQALARPLEEAQSPTEVLEVLVFSLAGEHYGIETAHVLEAVPLRGLTPVPCTPLFVLGVVSHRGRILPVLDLRRLFELAGQGVPEGSRIVVVEAGGMTFGIFADAVSGVERIEAHEVAPPPAASAGDRQAFLLGVTGAMVAVLDMEKIASDRKIVVQEQGEA